MPIRFLKRFLAIAPIAAAIGFATLAAECEQHVEFADYVKEACGDNADNDKDGKIDCKDTDCDAECRVELILITPSPITYEDSLLLKGSHTNATSITGTINPKGTAGIATINGSNWELWLNDMIDNIDYTVTIVGSDAQNNRDTVTATFQKRDPI